MNRREQGSRGEEIAASYLIRHGARILERNYRRPGGEIDLIARIGDTIAFVEVKRRTSPRYGTPGEAVVRSKQRRIAQTALYYVQENALEDEKMRFDVIEITPDGVRHIPCAFDDLFSHD